jgi:hypothetical protein
MRINREELLSDLLLVKSGLSPREFIEQSSCFVFQDGQVMTFNDEVACRKNIGMKGITGAVQSVSLLAILEKMDDPILKVRENENGELEFRGKKKGFGVIMEAEVHLPIDRVEIPEKWKTLPKEFVQAVAMAQNCTSLDESRFLLTCVHIHPDYIEACDNHQAMRCNVRTGLKNPVLVRGSSIRDVAQLGMDQVALTPSWVHFRQSPREDGDQNGLIYSCRRYSEEYPDLSPILVCKGHPWVIPKGISQASERASVFAADKAGDPLIHIHLSSGILKMEGRGVSGWYREVTKSVYDGPAVDFVMAPKLLQEISTKYNEAKISADKMKIMGGKEDGISWEYVTVLGKKNDAEVEGEGEEDEKS